MLHVFVSYSRLEADWVVPFAEELGRSGVDVWIDLRDIPVTIPWLDVIRDAVEESSLFLICESPHWSSSDSCAAENAISLEFDKPTSRVTVGSDIALAIQSVQRDLVLMSPHVLPLVELRVRARDWARAGRPRAMLLPHQSTRPLQAAANHLGMPTPAAEEYLRACYKRSTRRSALAMTSVVLVVLGVVALVISGGTHTVATSQNRRAFAGSNEANRAVAQIRHDPYGGLLLASKRGGDESAYNAVVTEAALDDPVPDDAFRTDRELVGFEQPIFDDEITVVDDRGGRWSRNTGDADVRQAEPATGRASDPLSSPLEVIPRPGTGIAEIHRDDHLVRVAATDDGPVVAAAGSPDGRRTAVASANSVSIIDVDTGIRRVRLVGSPHTLTDVAWSGDGRSVWATSGATAIGWTVADAKVILDEPDAWFQAILPADYEGEAWLVLRDGELRRVALETGKTLDQINLHDELYVVSVDPTGGHVLIGGEDDDHLVDLRTGRSKDLHLADCEIGRGAWMPDGSGAVVPCSGGPIVFVDGRSGKELTRVDIPGGGASTVSVAPTLDLFVGGSTGEVFHFGPSAVEPEELEVASCRSSVNALAVSTDASVAIPVGDGEGQLGCFRRGIRKDGKWTWDAKLSANDAGTSSVAAAVLGNKGGTFAIGFSDGTIQLRPTENILPKRRITSLSGAARSFLPGRDGELYVVTRNGQLASIPAADSVPSNAAFAEEAAKRLQRAKELGFTP